MYAPAGSRYRPGHAAAPARGVFMPSGRSITLADVPAVSRPGQAGGRL